MISAALFGALAGSGALPFPREAYEAAIRDAGLGVEASLRAFGRAHDAALAEFNVAAATGRLIAPELKLPVKLYDMERHYKEVRDKLIGFRGGLSE